MNKGKGATTIGATLLAWIMILTRTDMSTTPKMGSEALHNSPSSSETHTREGPWLASCRYWSSVIPTKGPGFGNGELRSNISDTIESDTSCVDDAWGIPNDSVSEGSAEISAIIATVPDPIHSHLSLDFDRAVDAILLAAAKNQYLPSNYWLPWRSRAAALSSAESASSKSEELEQSVERENQPGLVVLHYAPEAERLKKEKSDDTKPFHRSAYRRVVYLFLVAETPTLGVNGTELQNAFAYEGFLHRFYDATLSARPSPSFPGTDPKAEKLSIIGPFFSGSAASLHEGIERARDSLGISSVLIAGVTGTTIAADELDPDRQGIYLSFGENTNFEQDQFLTALDTSGYDLCRVAVLSEGGTVFGTVTKAPTNTEAPTKPTHSETPTTRTENPMHCKTTEVQHLSFPREISLLRNAQASQTAKPTEGSTPPSPYLNLSLKDFTADDTILNFSEQSAASIEAQLMAIARQLERTQTQFILISASNVLDDIFLAQFLHRACPNARLVIFSGGDLLFERDGENGAYVGSISISPYLLSFVDMNSDSQWLFSDYQSEAIYNAAYYVFWSRSNDEQNLRLIGYMPYGGSMGIPLWATAIGADGYYPLGILGWCASDFDEILPSINLAYPPTYSMCSEPKQQMDISSLHLISRIRPASSWFILASIIFLLCVFHTCLLMSANQFSAFTRDLAIHENDEPRRRAVYLNIGTAVLSSMAFVTAYPMVRVGHFYPVSAVCYAIGGLAILAGAVTLGITLKKTWRYCRPSGHPEYSFFNLLAAVAFAIIAFGWVYLCHNDNPHDTHSFAGFFFSYRCLNPFNGLNPLVPILWLLFGWYLWSICQTARLRFSKMSRPRLASKVEYRKDDSHRPSTAYPLFVSDNALAGCSKPTDPCLYENITCLLITREVLRRFAMMFWPPSNKHESEKVGKRHTYRLNLILAIFYLLFFGLCVFSRMIQSLDHFLFAGSTFSPTLYEFLVTSLFFPLLMVALAGWLRTIMVWGALSRGLLEPLERLPIRFAFTPVTSSSWMNMLRQSGLHIRWRDMGRTMESIRQLVHHPVLSRKYPSQQTLLVEQYESLNTQIEKLTRCVSKPDSCEVPKEILDNYPIIYWDRPNDEDCVSLSLIQSIELHYAAFCHHILRYILIPYWDEERSGFVRESNPAPEVGSTKDKAGNESSKDKVVSRDPEYIRLCEELLVIRYVALIRAVLVNIRYMMLFVSAAFVVAILAWNSYPFHPHAVIDWCFTGLLFLLGTGFVWVFAQMHRNAILSRITDTKPNELGWEFYLRIITFGAVPVLTWLAYQFPQIGGNIFRILQPGLQVAK